MSETPAGVPVPGHWFTDKDLDVLLFKVNRRLLARGTLFEDMMRGEQPSDPLQHILDNLTRWQPQAESGRRFKRDWQVGNLKLSEGDAVLTGRIGWQRSGQGITTVYDSDAQEWIDRDAPKDVSAVAPFAVLADGRFLGVLRHSSFVGTTLAKVFTDLLNSAERQRSTPTTDFDVEPVGDSQQFFDWLQDVDRVTKVEFTFKRPNPDAEESFRELFERQAAYQADEIRDDQVKRSRAGAEQGSVSHRQSGPNVPRRSDGCIRLRDRHRAAAQQTGALRPEGQRRTRSHRRRRRLLG